MTKEAKNKNNEGKTEDKQKEISNDMFSPENMAKMFAMFKQFESIEKEKNANIQEANTKEALNNAKFTKVMLSKIGDEIITVRSAVDNVNFLSPKTQTRYKWLQKGDVETLSVSEILAMENVSRRFLHTPWLIIEDKRVMEALDLKNTYDLIEKVENIDELIKLSKDEMEKIFNELPDQYKNNFRNEILKKVKSRELNNLTTIDNLSEILKINLRTI